MTTQWPKETTWPNDPREHATQLSKYLRDALISVENAKHQPVPAELVKISLLGSLSFVMKTQSAPDFRTVLDTLNIIRTEQQATTSDVTQAVGEFLGEIKGEIMATTKLVRESNAKAEEVGQHAKALAKEAVDTSKITMNMVKEIKNQGVQSQAASPATYAAIAARGTSGPNTNNAQISKTPSAQIQREIIVSIKDPLTIQSLRAMNPRNLKSHIERSIEQSRNEHIVKIKIVSANQLKSGDLSIKTATNSEMRTLREFADDWAPRIGHGCTVRNPTYGILAHGIRTSSMDMSKFEDNKRNILLDNKPFIPSADLKYIGWLTRAAPTKSASTIIIEFTRPEDANKIIDEGLVWQGEVFQCERYERQCRLMQCFNCQHYSHIGTQCKTATTCGYCAQEHRSRDCTTKDDADAPRKCANCHGAHEAWSHQCPTRQGELAKTKAAYNTRQRYHAVVSTAETPKISASNLGPVRRRSTRDFRQSQEEQQGRDPSQPRRGRKRPNMELDNTTHDKENYARRDGSNQRPQRAAMPSRKVLEAIEGNRRRPGNGQYMEIDSDSEEI
jgi:hypothetical protein